MSKVDVVEYPAGSLLPDMGLFWRDWRERLVDLTAYASFRLTLQNPVMSGPSVTKTAGFTAVAPAEGSPNVLVAWTAGEIDTLKPATYEGRVQAFRGDAKPRILLFRLKINAWP